MRAIRLRHSYTATFGREPFSLRPRFNELGAAMMEDDMAVDIELWLILAAMAGWIFLGCMVTYGRHGPAKARRGFDRR